MMEFLEGLRIEMMERGGILVVHVDGALAVSDGKFGLATQINRAGYGAIRGVDRGGVFAAAVEGEDALGDGIVNDGVGIRICFNGADGFQHFEVKDGYIVRTAVAVEAATEVGSDSDAMDTLGVGDVADDGVGVRIENHRVSAARDVNTAGVAVYIDVVPTTLAADRDSLDNVITARARRRRGRARECYGRKDYRHCQ